MLLSAGVPINASEIRLLIIDPDMEGGDVIRTKHLLAAYQEVYNELHQTAAFKNQFCATKIEFALPDGFYTSGFEKLDWCGRRHVFDEREKWLADAFDETTMSFENKALFHALYSEYERYDLIGGTKGRQHIFCLAFVKFLKSEGFEYILKDFAEGDRFFIISSIFGGTGASGFPLLLQALSDGLYHHGIRKVRKGAITLFPYFHVESKMHSKIDGRTFNRKTITTLHYYSDNLWGLDTLYYLGDTKRAEYDNEMGGFTQKNNAHLLEFLAATSIIDFMATEKFYDHFREYGMRWKLTDHAVNFQDLDISTQEIVARPLTQFCLMRNYIRDANFQNAKWFTHQGIGEILKRDFYKDGLLKIFKAFDEWLTEMEDNTRAFAPFNLYASKDKPFSIVTAVEEKKGGLLGRSSKSYEYFTKALDKAASKVETDRGMALAFLELFWNATKPMVTGDDAVIQFSFSYEKLKNTISKQADNEKINRGRTIMRPVFNSNRDADIAGWGRSVAFDTEDIKDISDPVYADPLETLESTPTLFNRMELARIAFEFVGTSAAATNPIVLLEGNTAYHQLVSECLDVGELFFFTEKHEKELQIIEWNRRRDLYALLTASNNQKYFGYALDMFMEYRHGVLGITPASLEKIYLLNYPRIGGNGMKILGGTSPYTLFFAADCDKYYANFTHGEHRTFYGKPVPLYRRDPLYIKFWFALKHCWQTITNQDRGFGDCFPVLDTYLKVTYEAIKSKNQRLASSLQGEATETLLDYWTRLLRPINVGRDDDRQMLEPLPGFFLKQFPAMDATADSSFTI